MTFAKGHMSDVCQHFQRASPLKVPDQFHLNFICSLLAKGKENIYGPGHMTMMSAMPVYGKE